MEENKLRKQVKDMWGKQKNLLTWVEPNKGSTVGAPDVLIPVDSGLWIPMELKGWKCSDDYVADVTVEPSQISWHDECAMARMRALVLARIIHGDDRHLVLMSGWHFVKQCLGRNRKLDLNHCCVLWLKGKDKREITDVAMDDAGFWYDARRSFTGTLK